MKRTDPRGLAPILLAIAVASAGQLHAQTDPPAVPPEAPPLPRYFLEILVFSNTGGVASSAEDFSPRIDPLASESETADEALPANVYGDDQARMDARPSLTADTRSATEQTGSGDTAGESADEFRFELLDAGQLTLTSERDKLERLSAYSPIFHGGWVQEGYPEERAQAFDLGIIDSMAPLSGTVTFYRSRFLHVRVALEYLTGAVGPPVDSAIPVALSRGFAGPQPSVRYAINESRRLRSGELHYLDHPAFGMLILITPEPEPEILELDMEPVPAPPEQAAPNQPAER